MNSRTDNFASFDEFISLYDCKLNPSLRDVTKPASIPPKQFVSSSTSVKEETSNPSLNNEVEWTTVPFARISKRVRRSNGLQDHFSGEDTNNSDLNGRQSTADIKYRKHFSLGHIGCAKREKNGDGIRVEYLESKPFPFGVYGNKVVAVHENSPQNNTISRIDHQNSGCSDSIFSVTEDLPMQPWNLRKRKRLSTSRQKRSGFEVDAHIALLKRKHAEFNWEPKCTVSTSSSSDPEEAVLPQEGMLQKVPNTSPPLRRKQLERTPHLYMDSPHLWPKYHESVNSGFSLTNSTIQDQILPGNDNVQRPVFTGYTSDEDFHLNVGNVPDHLPNFNNDSDILPPAVPSCWAVDLQDSVKEE